MQHNPFEKKTAIIIFIEKKRYFIGHNKFSQKKILNHLLG